ncbi:MAG TPA: tyrosine-type recombinase/integrase [Solirubrobacteraceae bacterium]|nr:tyrosine-type recombinase/integrase [Solirubrobacteraceae bacterium]
MRPPTGSVVEHEGRDGLTYRSLRFTAYGKRRRVPLGAVSATEAQSALRHMLADVERGVWRPAAAAQAPSASDLAPTFGEFAMEWWTLTKDQFAPSTQADYWWRLTVHLAKFFNELRVDEITFDTVERYIAAKLAEDKPLSPRSINMTVTLLGAILERAVERDLIPRNPARGKARRVKERAPARSYLDAADQITALLDAAGELDRTVHTNGRHVERRASIATLTFAGLRIGELCSLRWRDVDLAGGWLNVQASKTDAGRRRVKVRGALRDELVAVRQRQQEMSHDAYVFATSAGRSMSKDNFRNRVLRPAVTRASERLEAAGHPPLPDGLTPHSLRRTFASVLYALGEDPGVVMDEMGHTDPALALRVYRQAMRRDEREKALLRDLVDGGKHSEEVRADSLSGGVVVELAQ